MERQAVIRFIIMHTQDETRKPWTGNCKLLSIVLTRVAMKVYYCK